jgi:FlaA1/EpsC-like NDP-sugar epimerase
MEDHPAAAVDNNFFGTRAVADAAAAAGAERFILISTDKAVNPRSVMGATKRLAELYVQHAARGAQANFAIVRFGNVLGSSGSVIPIFRRQIERGGPVTVTHPEMTRFFMTIPEAVSLIVQAGAIGGRGEVFVLDMGEPVRIIDLARNMIELSGKDPDQLRIEFIGARPGEKLHEELWADGETVSGTGHTKIHLVTRPSIDAAWLAEELGSLERLVEEGDTLELVAKLAAMMKEPRREPVEEPAAQQSSES